MDDARKNVLIEWADARIQEAEEAANQGTLSKIHSLAQNPAFKYYMDNVYFTKAVLRNGFKQYVEAMAELNRLYEAEQAEIARDVAIADGEAERKALREEVDALKAQMQQLIEAQKPVDQPAPKAKKPAKAEPVVEDEPAAETESDEADS